jgi:hypothetical protein
MRNTVSLALLAILVAACGPGPLPLKDMQGTGYHIEIDNAYPAFTEKTFGSSLAQAAANSLVAPAQQNHNEIAVPTGKGNQTVMDSYVPLAPIGEHIRAMLEARLGWHEVAENPDYKLIFANNGWGIKHHPLKVSTYSIFYSMTVNIQETRIQPKNKVARSRVFGCYYQSDSDYYYDEVYQNSAAAVAQAMQKAIPACIESLNVQFDAAFKKDSKSGS